MQQYLDLIASVASEAEQSDLVMLDDCSCHLDKIRHGWESENYDSWRRAVERWAHHCAFMTMYWAIHHRGKHLLIVKNRYRLRRTGPVTFVPDRVKG